MPDAMETLEFDEKLSPTGETGSGFVLVESPNSKARAMRALKREQEAARNTANQEQITSTSSNNRSVGNAGNEQPRTSKRDKNLPLIGPPPVGPVLPTFEDLQPRRGSGGDAFGGGDMDGAPVKRKPSMVKKLREKMVSK